ncbi:MAG: alpha-galactosidase, partial [Lachnospiraceae bacterium]|nr:alpha-galactosidase [Lachnospiraceae bacterium]
QNWGYKVGDSWRILNDITFRVGSDGDPGFGAWENDYTTGVTSQYNKAVILDEFAGLDKGWNDPDMLMIGMNGLDEVMCRSHMTMWCMMNSPLMLGMDLRRVEKGDWMYRIISNRELIALNQDALGIQAKRIYTSNQSGSALSEEEAGKPVDQAYLRGNDRVDVLAKPLSDGSIALSFLNLSGEKKTEGYRVDADLIDRLIGRKMVNRQEFAKAERYRIRNLWTGEETVADSGSFGVDALDAHDQVTYRITPV